MSRVLPLLHQDLDINSSNHSTNFYQSKLILESIFPVIMYWRVIRKSDFYILIADLIGYVRTCSYLTDMLWYHVTRFFILIRELFITLSVSLQRDHIESMIFLLESTLAVELHVLYWLSKSQYKAQLWSKVCNSNICSHTESNWGLCPNTWVLYGTSPIKN